MGTTTNTNAASIGIEIVDAGDNSTVINNIVIGGGMDTGIWIGSEWTNITGNVVDVSNGIGGDGITLSSASNNILYNNYASSNNLYGFLLTASSSNDLTSNIGTSNSSVGFYLNAASNNNILINNSGRSYSSYGIALSTSLNNNTLTNNTRISYSSHGIYLYYYANYNNLTGNIGTSNSGNGIQLISSSDNNTLTNNIATSNSGQGLQIYASAGNILTNNIATSNSSYALYLYMGSKNNVIYGQTAIGYLAGSYGIYIIRSVHNNTIQDCVNITGVAKDVSIANYYSEKSVNNTFINCTYNVSKETVDDGSSLIRKWYYQANVTDNSSNPVSSAMVTTGMEMPNNRQDYSSVNGVNMSGNVLLLHMNNNSLGENATYVVDSSGSCYDNETQIMTLEETDCSNVDYNNLENYYFGNGNIAGQSPINSDNELVNVMQVGLRGGSELGEKENAQTDEQQMIDILTDNELINNKNNLSSVSIIMVSEENENNPIILFVNPEFKDLIIHNMDSSFTSEVIGKRLVMMRVNNNLIDFVVDNLSKNGIFSSSFVNLLVTNYSKSKFITHFLESNSLKNSSAELYTLPVSFNDFFNNSICSGLGGNSSTGCQSICSQNSQSSSVTSPVTLYLCDMSLLIKLITALTNNSEFIQIESFDFNNVSAMKNANSGDYKKLSVSGV